MWIRLLQSKETKTRTEFIFQRSTQARGGPLSQRIDRPKSEWIGAPRSSNGTQSLGGCVRRRGTGARALAGMREGRGRRKRTGEERVRWPPAGDKWMLGGEYIIKCICMFSATVNRRPDTRAHRQIQWAEFLPASL